RHHRAPHRARGDGARHAGRGPGRGGLPPQALHRAAHRGRRGPAPGHRAGPRHRDRGRRRRPGPARPGGRCGAGRRRRAMIGALVRAPLPPVLREVGRRDDVLVVRIGVDDAELERLLAAAGAAEDGRAGTGGAAVPEPVTKAVTDLDEVEVDHPLAAEPVGHLVLISGTMTDLRRAVAVRSLLPPARNITIAVGALPYLWPAPLPTATAHPGWRHLTDVHIRVVEKRSWVMEAEFA